jgi:hypothetical protein
MRRWPEGLRNTPVAVFGFTSLYPWLLRFIGLLWLLLAFLWLSGVVGQKSLASAPEENAQAPDRE